MQLTAGDHIRNLLGEYCHRIDAGDFDGVGELFAHGSLADEHGNELARGASDVAAFYAATTRRHDDGTPRTKHVVTNMVLEPSDDGMVVAHSDYVVLMATDGLALQPIITGGYVDTFAPDDDGSGWHFAERRFRVDHLGDLSEHLMIDL